MKMRVSVVSMLMVAVCELPGFGVQKEALSIPSPELADLPFSALDENYFIMRTSDGEVKFQISLKYQLLESDKAPDCAKRLYFFYTQKSYWDLFKSSAPFSDHNFNPGFRYEFGEGPSWAGNVVMTLEHLSNGRDGEASRSLNRATIGTSWTPWVRKHYAVSVEPRAWVYLGEPEPANIDEYLGYAELELEISQRADDPNNGARLSVMGRCGSDFDQGAVEVNLSVPIKAVLTDAWFNPRIFVQLWSGVGEKLIEVDESSTSLRVGLELGTY